MSAREWKNKRISSRILQIVGLAWAVALSGEVSVKAQDIHFSQFFAVPMWLNPAMTGFIPTCWRVALIGRQQWRSVMQPYNTVGLSGEMSFPVEGADGVMGAGALVVRDWAGDGPYVQQGGLLSVSFRKSTGNRLNPTTISGGLQAEVFAHSVDKSKLVFPDQYDWESGDFSLPTAAAVKGSSLLVGVNVGVFGVVPLSPDFSLYGGVTGFHLNQPRVSLASSGYGYPMKFVVHSGARYNLENLSVLPNVFFAYQRKAMEITMGGSVEYEISSISEQFLSGGLYYRVMDAMMLMVGGGIGGLTGGIAVDLNIGPLSRIAPASRGWGGIEFVLRYSGECPSRVSIKGTVPCPRM